MALSSTIKAIQDIMRKDVGVDGDAQRIGQLVWLLFLKNWDDREQELELLENNFVSPLVGVRWIDAAGETHKAPDLRWRAWAANPEGTTGDTLLAFVNDTLFPALKGLEPGPRVQDDSAVEALRRRRTLVKSVFEDVYQTRETAKLFLMLIVELLKPGGRAAVVLPDGPLFGEGVKTRIKERLLSECELHTIVRLPKGVFAPYTSIQTNILFFTKGRPTRDVWYYEHPYPPGFKSYSKTKPMRIAEFDPEKAWWNERKETAQAWKVTIDEIRARGFNLDFKNPNAPGETHEDPDVLLARYDQARSAVAAIREQLRQALAEALEGRA